ncbi:MAG: hypothetical protein JSU70_14775 [Phycisphaerales bacterium]|nr:MAG: hypothetical protein JSU70_14775 [Phycisphaerales bacterium]
MKYSSLLLALATMLIAAAGCEQATTTEQAGVDSASKANTTPTSGQQSAADEEPPLLLDDEPPLLLDDEPPLLLDDSAAKPAMDSGADNSRCFVCHINYTQEDIAVTHARAGIGCKDCHGESDAHIADESWASGGNGTAPDRMYTRDKINPACMACHPKSTIDAPQHEPLFAGPGDQKYCTDCHGEHRLPSRRCKWK